ncbi:putative cyclic nucleotide-binding domain protein [Dorea sp. D27]|nr:Crp/Fnr family transcriptional regulator [Dorea sp. D27]KMZ53564.1 putative cyclic nucleotide-binding domain protein [Dorea sp. D27]
MMNKYIPLLQNTKMFSGIDSQEIDYMLSCLSAKIHKYDKDSYIIRSGDPVVSLGMVLSGSVLIIKEDFWGNRSILSEILPGTIFAESYACLPDMPIEASAVADSYVEVMFFDIRRILTACTSACTSHTRLIQNLLAAIAAKNVILTKKIEHLTKRTIRERLLSYLSAESLKYGCPTFEIPFNRQQLADYLSVDRSALSNEISKLQSEGILICKKNRFTMNKNIP